MAEEHEMLAPHTLRAIDAKLDVIIGDLSELKMCVSRLEHQATNLHRDIAGIGVAIAERSAIMDRIEARLFRIEQKLARGTQPD